jgi:hypothetical protein
LPSTCDCTGGMMSEAMRGHGRSERFGSGRGGFSGTTISREKSISAKLSR